MTLAGGDPVAARGDAARTAAQHAVTRWPAQRAELLAKYEQAVEAIRLLVVACNEHALDVTGTINDIAREDQAVGPIPQLRVERQLGNASGFVINGTRANGFSPRFLPAEAVWQGLTTGGLGAHNLTKTALVEAEIDIYRDADGYDHVGSPSRRLRAEHDVEQAP